MTPTGARTKRALSIGIDAYEKISVLDGCVNDVKLMRQVLTEVFGFDEANMTLLTNEQANRVNILAALDTLIEQTGEGDIVVIHYAGHGSQMTDLEGDEPSGLDSTIMPVNSEGWSGDNHDITDDEIHLRLLKLGEKTDYITLIFDCCHSGTITRDAFGGKARSAPADRRPPEEIRAMRQRLGIALLDRSNPRRNGPSGLLPLSGKYVLMSGCRDEELSYEHKPEALGGETAHGALTWFLTNELRRATPGTTYRDVYERAAANVTAANRRQHPQMEGTADREIFGIRDFEPMRFVRVLRRSGQTVTLGAGAAFGVTAGSKYDVHTQGTKQTEGVERLGEIEVTSVQATTAQAKIVEESAPDAIAADARAFETEHVYGDMRLAVEVVAPPALEAEGKALIERIEASKSVKLADAGQGATMRAYLLAARAEVGADAPAPQLGALAGPTWAVVREDGELAMPPKTPAQLKDVVANLETIARYRLALGLVNPDPDSRLAAPVEEDGQLLPRFEIQLLRPGDAEGEWVVAEPDPDTSQIVFEAMDPPSEEQEREWEETGDYPPPNFGVRIISRHDKPVFATMLDFGVAGAISLLYPAPGAQEMLRENGNFSVTDLLPLSFPTVFPFAEDPVHGGAAEGTETIKLIITTKSADFSFLRQESVRSAAVRAPSPLESLWESAAKGSATRDAKRRPTKPKTEAEDWTTVVKPFVLRRRTGAPLDASGEPVKLGTVALKTDGLSGEATLHTERGRAAAAALQAGGLLGALEAENVELRQTVSLSNTRETGPASRSARGAPAIEVQIEDPGAGRGQMLLTTDETGAVSWVFAEPAPAGARGGPPVPGGARTYVIPRAKATAPAGEPGARGVIGAVGRKLLKELVFPLVDPLIGAVTETFVGRWEARNRPYGIRTFTPDDYTQAVDYAQASAGQIDGEGWKRLGAGRALLLVHGTFSRAHSAFGALPRESVEALHALYDGRVFALDHFTLSQDPKQNVNWLLDRLPGDASLDVDIICHSRGGLVSRVLNEKQSELSLGSRSLRVGRIIFVGSPNAGTILADGDHVGDLIDTYTNIANFIPDIGVSDVISGVITVAKQIAVGAVGGLKGLQSMRPEGDFGQWLNAGDRAGDTRYFALTSDYTPAEPGLANFAKNRLMDLIFKGPNDLVVPTNGVFEDNGSGFFPIEDRHVFTGTDGIAHTAFFGNRAARDKMMSWLQA